MMQLQSSARKLLGLWEPRHKAPRAALSSPDHPEGSILLGDASKDEFFRRVCAVYADGLCLVAAGYESDNRLRSILVDLARNGAIPKKRREVSSSLEEIEALYSDYHVNKEDARFDAARRLGQVLDEAARARASDVVFVNESRHCRIYAIVNDRMIPVGDPITPLEGAQMMGMLFHSKDEGSSQSSYQRNKYQGFSLRAGGAVPLPQSISALRCQRGPEHPQGDHLYARLFYRDTLDRKLTLEGLGFTAAEVDILNETAAALRGGIFIGGSTGDGKSTTIAVALSLLLAQHDGKLNLVTVEDPVEYEIPGARQTSVPTVGSGEERARHFKEALMHFCRIHPACGMVSEIRDADAARQVLQFVDTGHQVWTTIHVDNANGILFRLLDMGVSTAEVVKPGNIRLLMKQTLLPHLCPDCALDAPAGGREVPAWLTAKLTEFEQVKYRNPLGCESCRKADQNALTEEAWGGYLGQKAVCEMIQPDERYLAFVRDRDPLGAWKYWLEGLGGVPIGDKIARFVSAGRVDPFDAVRKGAALGKIQQKQFAVVEGGKS